jgi:predicted RND superfamily exporter protein
VNRLTLSETVARGLLRRSPLVLLATVVMTLALVWPLVFMAPTSLSSPEPPGDIFEVRDVAARRFDQGDHRMVFVIEAREGNLLRREVLLELYDNSRALRRAPGVADLLVPVEAAAEVAGQSVAGLLTLADAVEGQLRQQGLGGLADAPPEAVEAIVNALLAQSGPAAFGLSVHTQEPRAGRDSWRSPALLTYVTADNQALGGGHGGGDLGGGDTSKEEFGRQVLALLRGEQRTLQVWGLALDANLTSLEQGRQAGPFIAFTVAAVLLLFMAFFRSYWTLAVTGGALAALMIWIKGLSNLVGLENDQILTTIVPIAMVSFGIDFAFHALGRYREEQVHHRLPRQALRAALVGVLGALVVAMVSDGTAFLANTTTAIDSLVQFGLAASLATVSGFWLLGLVTPLAVMHLDELFPRSPSPTGRAVLMSWVSATLAVAAVTTSVVLTAFVSAFWGAACWVLYVVCFLVVPALYLRRVHSLQDTHSFQDTHSSQDIQSGRLQGGRSSRAPELLSQAVVALARRRRLVLPLVLAATMMCAYLAHQIRADFDVRDYFAATTDFVVGLDKFDEHVGDQGGEPAFVYIEADLTDPRLVQGLARFVEQVERLDTDRLARRPDGRVLVEAGLMTLLDSAELNVTDVDGQRLSDLYQGAWSASSTAAGGGDRVPSARRFLWLDSAARESTARWGATRVDLRLPGSRRQENIESARADLEPLVSGLRAELQALDGRARVVLTGRPLARQASLDAVLWAFRLSIPVALVLCLVVASLFMGSLRYGIMSVIPVTLVVAWLYGLMHAWGYSVNVVTATIGALSIGIGIDFSVHLVLRFREELARQPSRQDALKGASRGTGGALAGSAASSIVGFAVLAWAPMPMFAAYGLLTALMILLALLATLVVLPCLLMWDFIR